MSLAGGTFTSHEALTPLPSLTMAVMVVVPGAIAVTIPVLSMVAMHGLLLYQNTRFLSASLELMLIIRVSPSVRITNDSLKTMLVIAVPCA